MSQTDGSILAWYFAPADWRLCRSTSDDLDNRWLITAGTTHEVTYPSEMRARRLYACVKAFDALRHARSANICRVRLSGTISRDDEVYFATRCEYLAVADATKTLHRFACVVAREILSFVACAGLRIDSRSWNAVLAKDAWLAGDIDDAALCMARTAAWEASTFQPSMSFRLFTALTVAAKVTEQVGMPYTAREMFGDYWCVTSMSWAETEAKYNSLLESMLRELLGGVE